jgi:pimeloyl-ACP methyl ester carboxylesterase
VGSEITGQDRFDIHLDTGGGRLEAVWIGPGPDQAPTLIFLHEGLGCVDLWRDVPARLAGITGWGALVYSRLGYGRSDPCPLPRTVDFMHHEGLTVLPDVIRQTGIGNYVLVGHSDGGSIALIHAGGSPCPGLKGIITLAAHVFCEDLTRRSIEAARQRYLNGDLKARLFPYHGENTHCAFWGWSDVWLHPDFRSWTIETFLPAIRVPVLAIQGQTDPYGSQAQVDAIRTNIGGAAAIAVLADCGHAPHLEQTDTVFEAISTFMTQRLLISSRGS